MFRLLVGTLCFLASVSGTLLSDSNCSCVVTKTAATAPGAAASITAGCSIKPDWLSSTSKWCLTDQVASPGCGTLQTGFGWADTCNNTDFTTFSFMPPVVLAGDQTNITFYTGQTLTVNWTSQKIAVDEWLRLTYMGVSLRTLTTGSGVNVTAGTFSARISDSANSLTPVGGSPLILSTTNPAISVQSQQNIAVLQSRITAVNVFDGNRTVGAGSIVCDNRNVTIQWLSVGQAGVGVATVTIRSNGGGGGTTVGTALTGILVSPGNMTVNYVLPRSFVPSGFGTYSAQISVQSPGSGVAPYTLSSTGFTLTVAPSVSPSPTASNSATKTPSISPSTTSTMSLGASFSPTPSITPTISLTPTGSLSFGSTPSGSPSISQTPSITPSLSVTSSQTPTSSITPSQTQTPAPSVDYVGIAKAAAAESDAKTGGIVGGLVALLLLGIVAYKIKQRHEAHLKRSRRLKTPARNYEEEARSLYGVQPTLDAGGTVMYQVNMPQQMGPGRSYQSNSSRRMSNRRN
jgi:hypothetical protein